jgi:hypothetical protein
MVKVKGKDKFFEHHTMEAYWMKGGIPPRILNLGTKLSGQLHNPVTLPLGKESMVPVG